MARTCRAETGKGEPCRQAPLQESEFCFWHSPDHTTEAAEARRLGAYREGLRLPGRLEPDGGRYGLDSAGQSNSERDRPLRGPAFFVGHCFRSPTAKGNCKQWRTQ